MSWTKMATAPEPPPRICFLLTDYGLEQYTYLCVSRLKEALGVWRHSIFVVHHETCRSGARLGDWACVHASSRILSERSIDIVGKPTDIYALHALHCLRYWGHPTKATSISISPTRQRPLTECEHRNSQPFHSQQLKSLVHHATKCGLYHRRTMH